MQFGSLSSGDQATFIIRQAAITRKPTWVVWISNIGDPSDYVRSIDTEAKVESAFGRGRLNVGRAVLTASNESGLFYSSGKSTIPKNSRMKIWAGFGNLNIPIFTGVVLSVDPLLDRDLVEISCTDYMGLLREMRVDGHQGSNNTIKLITEDFASTIGAQSNIPSNDETNETLTKPTFEPQRAISALEELMDAIFSVALFDEDGKMQVYPREFLNDSGGAFTFKDDNVLDSGATQLADRETINDVSIEYRDDFLARSFDTESIDRFRTRERRIRIAWMNYTEVSEQTTGNTEETIDHDLEGFLFTTSATTAKIDTIALKFKQISGSGNITVKIYTKGGAGEPNTLLGTSQSKAAADFNTSYSWEYFNFSPAIDVSASTDYWGVVDSTGRSGTISVKISAAAASGKHAYEDSGWTLESDKKMLHKVRGSLVGQRVARDIVRFYKAPKERIALAAPAIPQLQLMDEVLVDVSLPVISRYRITGRRHRIRPESYITIDTLESV